MQAQIRWTPPGGTLGAIVREAEARARLLDRRAGALHRDAEAAARGASLEQALRGASVAVVAEVKRRSPSKGDIATRLDAVAQAKAYAAGGAAAVSILTEPKHFGGSIEDLREVRGAVAIAVLKKDFHVTPIQVVEARALGASAALVIVRAVSPLRLAELLDAGRTLDLELLLEVRDEAELERALAAGATMVGVNNRDLETLEIDRRTSARLIPRVPESVLAIAESGVESRADVERCAAFGADAVLVGSALSRAADPQRATRELVGIERRARDR